jgi:hypothetical protein
VTLWHRRTPKGSRPGGGLRIVLCFVHTARATIARVSALQNANTANEICTLQKCVRMAPKKQDVMAWNRRARGRKKITPLREKTRAKEKGSKLKLWVRQK